MQNAECKVQNGERLTLEEFADLLNGREYGSEITPREEALAKELGFVVVFGYSDDNAELRGAIDDEIGCFDGGELEHEDLPDKIYADWCPKDLDCAWAYRTSLPHAIFRIYDEDGLYCMGIVCDINKPPLTNGDRIRAMSDEELADGLLAVSFGMKPWCDFHCENQCADGCDNCIKAWLRQPAKEET